MSAKKLAGLPKKAAGKFIKDAIGKSEILKNIPDDVKRKREDLIQHTIKATLHAAANIAVNVVNKSPIANSDAAAYIKAQLLKEVPICCGVITPTTPMSNATLDKDPCIVISLDDGKTTTLPTSSFIKNGTLCLLCGGKGVTPGVAFGRYGGISHTEDCVVGNAIHAAYEKMSGRTIMKG